MFTIKSSVPKTVILPDVPVIDPTLAVIIGGAGFSGTTTFDILEVT